MTGLRVVAERGLGIGRLAEFVSLYFGVPLLMATLLPAVYLWPTLGVMTILAAVLLARTPGFRWVELTQGIRTVQWGFVAAVTVAAVVGSLFLVWLLVPHRAFILPHQSVRVWVAVLAAYPFLSALPQELIFRALFFRRYGALFATRRLALGVNGALFAFSHLIFWNWVAIVLCFAAGIIFSRAYLSRGGFPQAVLLHAICGCIIFTVGLGVFFYIGAVPR